MVIAIGLVALILIVIAAIFVGRREASGGSRRALSDRLKIAVTALAIDCGHARRV